MVSVQIIYFLSIQFGLILSWFSILVSHAELSEYHMCFPIHRNIHKGKEIKCLLK